MISRKTLGILFGVLVALGLVSIFTGRSRYSTASDGGFVDILDDSFDPASVQTIKAWLGSKPDEAVELARTGDGWVVASRWDWTAKEDLVKRLLDDLSGLRGEIRASSADVLEDFQTDEKMGLHVVASGSGDSEIFHLVVGKTSIRGGGFVRKQDSNDVYLTQAALRSSFGVWGDEPKAPDAKRWIELRVHQADRNDIDRIVIRNGTEEISLEKEFELIEAPPAATDADTTGDEPDNADVEAAPAEPTVDRTKWTWRPDAAGDFDKGKVDGILSTLCSLYAFDVADPDSAEAQGLADPQRIVEIFPDAGDPMTVFFGHETEDGKQTYFRVGPDGKPALIYKSTVDRVFESREDLKPQA